MKIQYITTTVLCAQVGLAYPHVGNHHRFHKRSLVTVHSTVTEVINVVDYNAVVWVDNAGNIVTTEHKTSVPASTPASVTSVPVVVTHVSSKTTPTLPTSTPSVKSAAASSSEGVHVTTTHSTAAKATPSDNPGPSTSAIEHHNSDSSNGPIPGFGVAYDASTGGGCRPTLDGDFAFLASQGAVMIRIYDVCYTEAATAAAAHNLKLMVGITSFDDFDNHLNTLISGITSVPASWSVVDTVFIGNEVVNKGLASSADVAGKVSYARGILKTKGYTGNVVAVDTWTIMRNDATICSTSDYCAANAHAFFDGNTLPDGAGRFVRMAQDAVASKNSGKRIVISESGWPHAGAPLGLAVPSVDNQRTAMASIVKEFSGNASDLFLFMAYDATYKTTQAEVERNFGIFDASHYNGFV